MTPILPRTTANDLHAAQVCWDVAEKLETGMSWPLVDSPALKDVTRYLKGEALQEQENYDGYPDKAEPQAELPPYTHVLSPNHGGARQATHGIVIHSTRGGAPLGNEYNATLGWFASHESQVSAHVVIGFDGRRNKCVDHSLTAWHAKAYNATHLGVELEQPHKGDPISDLQYLALAEWIREMNMYYPALELVEHKDIDPQKSDIGAPFDMDRLKAMLE